MGQTIGQTQVSVRCLTSGLTPPSTYAETPNEAPLLSSSMLWKSTGRVGSDHRSDPVKTMF